MGRPAKETEDAYHVRFNRVEGVTDAGVLEWASSLGCAYAVCFEDADDEVAHPHYHCHLQRITDTRVKASLLKRWPALKNVKGETQVMSCKIVRDPESMDLYLWKGEQPQAGAVPRPPMILGYQGTRYFDPVKVHALAGQWWANRTALKFRKRKLQQTMKEELDAAVAKLASKTAESITGAVVDGYVGREKAINTRYLEGVVIGYLAKYNKGYRDRLKDTIVSNVKESARGAYTDLGNYIVDEIEL